MKGGNSMTLAEVMLEVKQLSRTEQTLLRTVLNDLLEQEDKPHRSLLELRGLGKELWEGVDAQDYIQALREEWDERP
jgi:hypothetical protein